MYGVLGLKVNVQTKKYDRLIIPVQSLVKIRERFFWYFHAGMVIVPGRYLPLQDITDRLFHDHNLQTSE